MIAGVKEPFAVEHERIHYLQGSLTSILNMSNGKVGCAKDVLINLAPATTNSEICRSVCAKPLWISLDA